MGIRHRHRDDPPLTLAKKGRWRGSIATAVVVALPLPTKVAGSSELASRDQIRCRCHSRRGGGEASELAGKPGATACEEGEREKPARSLWIRRGHGGDGRDPADRGGGGKQIETKGGGVSVGGGGEGDP
uniref:Uncharacterized protein n=1 Tax=Oryza glaberrima TaxID=4538 RepID=I1NQS8_ORYGL